ncbi:hypothetical protein EYF80_025210 [Liparis tanakae]|uniref:Uncharacterized protein n=1 Tax=Liparis tanakae TaxID=230148 RepID=A0A4Z2HI12_9TELE|nr:hypothetical protein EYF80_025210 [Liparis tanakae]
MCRLTLPLGLERGGREDGGMITPLARRDRQGGREERGRGAEGPTAGALESTDIGLNPFLLSFSSHTKPTSPPEQQAGGLVLKLRPADVLRSGRSA